MKFHMYIRGSQRMYPNDLGDPLTFLCHHDGDVCGFECKTHLVCLSTMSFLWFNWNKSTTLSVGCENSLALRGVFTTMSFLCLNKSSESHTLDQRRCKTPPYCVPCGQTDQYWRLCLVKVQPNPVELSSLTPLRSEILVQRNSTSQWLHS